MKKIIQLGKDLGVERVRTIVPIMIGRWEKKDIKLTPEERAEFFKLLEPNFVFWEQFCDGSVPFVCSSIIRYYAFVALYGDVQPCCYMPVSFGSVREEALKDIVERMWESSHFKVERANINKCDCPMNDPYVKERLMKMYKSSEGYPAKFDEVIYNSA